MQFSAALTLIAAAFVYALLFLVATKLLNSTINLQGLFADKLGSSRVRPERVQLLITTIAMSVQYLHGSLVSPDGATPKIEPGWFYLLGGSNTVYLIRKAVEGYNSKRLRG